jgi:cardiolipin synthase
MKRHIPNAISIARLLATPVLLAAMLLHHRGLFTWLLLACLLSDILDGLIARVFNLQSRLGALLDSTADMIVVLLSAAALFVFQQDFLSAHGAPLAALVALYLAEAAAAWWRYGRISSFHTLLSRLAAYSQGIFIMSLFLWGYNAWLFYLMLVLSAAALLEEIVILCMLPQWRSNVRGLYWLLSRP